MRLTHKQENFCNEYIIDFHGTNAAIRAGYSKNGAEVEASKFLRKPKISLRIKELLDGTERDYFVSRSKVLKAVEDMAYNGEQEGNRRGALDMLMKHTGHYEKDNTLEITTKVIDPFSDD